MKDDWTQMQWLHSFQYKTSYLSLWPKAEVVPKQKRLCSHCSFWPPTKGPLEKHSPWNYQTTSPPKAPQAYRDLWAKHILPISWEIIQLNEHIEGRNTGRNQSLLFSCIWTQTLYSHSQQRAEWSKETCCTYWLLPTRRCGSLLLLGSCEQHRHMNLHPVCSVVRGRCEGRRGSRWAAACVVNEDCLCLFPPARHLCTTPLLALAGPPLYSWEWQALLWIQSGQMGALQS